MTSLRNLSAKGVRKGFCWLFISLDTRTMKIRLDKSSVLDNWYSIVRVEHDGAKWLERVGPCASRLMLSERLTPEACIEGTGEEMVVIAHAIKKKESARFKRVAVHFEDDGVHFCSPRNSERDAVIPFEDANEFADQIIAEFAPDSLNSQKE